MTKSPSFINHPETFDPAVQYALDTVWRFSSNLEEHEDEELRAAVNLLSGYILGVTTAARSK